MYNVSYGEVRAGVGVRDGGRGWLWLPGPGRGGETPPCTDHTVHVRPIKQGGACTYCYPSLYRSHGTRTAYLTGRGVQVETLVNFFGGDTMISAGESPHKQNPVGTSSHSALYSLSERARVGITEIVLLLLVFAFFCVCFWSLLSSSVAYFCLLSWLFSVGEFCRGRGRSDGTDGRGQQRRGDPERVSG